MEIIVTFHVKQSTSIVYNLTPLSLVLNVQIHLAGHLSTPAQNIHATRSQNEANTMHAIARRYFPLHTDTDRCKPKALQSSRPNSKIRDMEIILNGQLHTLAENTTLDQLVEQLGLSGQRYAVEINERIVPRSQHARTHLHEQDKVEIIQAIGGG